ncbi:MAG: hypothetical protein JXR14_11895 [Paracoccaceae bacterium]
MKHMNDFDQIPDWPEEEDLARVSKALSSWYVRRDGKYFELENLFTTLSRKDVERAGFLRIRQEFPELRSPVPVMSAAFDRVIEELHDDPEQSIPTWNGRVECKPGEGRMIWSRGMVAVNAWEEPGYRSLRVNEADYGPFEAFLQFLFPREPEREMVLHWLAWNLQNEGDKPGWAVFLYSQTKGTGKSTFCRLVSKLFGEENSATQNNLTKLTGRFNMTMLRSKLVISEELKLKAETESANALKTYITESVTVGEMKGREAERVQQCCAFLFTTNHLPSWIEAGDRRLYVVEIDHEGHAAGPRADEFAALVGRVSRYFDDPAELGKL